MQLSLFTDAKKATESFITLPLPEANVRYYPQWLTTEQANDYQRLFEHTLPWRQETLRMFGKYVESPRLQVWYGDIECRYRYSGLTLMPHQWTPQLASLRDKCSALCRVTFNSVLVNWYRHGQDGMGLHADDEPELGKNPVIASVTLGACRPFVFKHKQTGHRYTYPLAHGSLLIMSGATQDHYFHGIPKTKKAINGRINLTFRHLVIKN